MKLYACCVVFLIIWAPALSVNGQTLFDNPEHAEYDAINNRHLVSSALNYSIIAIDNEGVQSTYLSNLGAYIFGIHISEYTLYVGDFHGRVRAFDLNSKNYLWEVTLPGANMIMGIVTDNAGFIYAINNNGYTSSLFKIDPSDQSYEVFVGNGLPEFPNDLAYDEPNNRLLLVGIQVDSPILGIGLDDASLTSVVTPPEFERAGITIDNDRNVYITSWYEGLVYKYDQTFTNPPILVSEGHGTITGTGLGYNNIDNILAVPVMSDNRVDFVSLLDTDDDAIIDYSDNCPNDPNFGQLDSDEDGEGDICDGCPEDFNPLHEDTDEDGIEDVCDNCPEHSNPGQEDTNENGVGDPCDYVCGDIDGISGINILDVVFLINNLYKSGPDSDPIESADVNHDLTINILDVVYLINNLYKAGPAPICS
ncbi:MAG: hypothetical protein GY865_07930 [candidate division Zixibacteria bacterium]|nr:hypothetical protein [candidate division Zixibacteria bacterium]